MADQDSPAQAISLAGCRPQPYAFTVINLLPVNQACATGMEEG